MNKPIEKDGLIPVREYVKNIISRRGYPVSVQYVYKLIKEHKEKGRELPFRYKEVGKGVWIVKEK